MPPPTPPLTYPTTTNTTETGQTARYTDSTLAVSIVSGLVGLFVLLLIIIAIIYCRMRWKRTSFSFARKSNNQSAFADIRMVSSTNRAGAPPNEPSNGRRKTKRRSESGMSVLPGGNKSSSSAALERARAGNASSRAVTIELHPTPMFSVDEHSAVDNPVVVDELAVHTTRTSAVDEQATIKANQANPFFSMSLK